MRIAFVADASHADVEKITSALATAGHEVHIFSLLPPVALIPGVTVHDLPRWSDSPRLSYVAAAPRLRRLLRALRPQVVHAYFATGNGLLAALAGVHPLVVSTAGSDVLISPQRSRLMRWLLRWVFRQADLVTTLAPHMERAVRQVGCEPGKLLTVLLNGISLADYPLRAPRPLGSPVRVICTRGMQARYRHDLILQTAHQLRAAGQALTWTLIGTGPARPALEAQARHLGLADIVRFTGRQPRTAIPSALAASDLFVSMSPTDGVSSSLLEAMATGVLPVVPDNEPNRGWIETGVGGILVPEISTPALSLSILHALEGGEELIARAAAHNRAVIEAHADLERTLAILIDHYRRLASRTAP